MADGACAARGRREPRERRAFYDAKIAIAQCYAEHVLVQAGALEASIVGAKGNQGVLALTEDQF
jgi:hypothetical protein